METKMSRTLCSSDPPPSVLKLSDLLRGIRTLNEEEGSFLGNFEEEQKVLLILTYILCLWLAVPPHWLQRRMLWRQNSQPEVENVGQNEQDPLFLLSNWGNLANFSLSRAIAHLSTQMCLKGGNSVLLS